MAASSNFSGIRRSVPPRGGDHADSSPVSTAAHAIGAATERTTAVIARDRGGRAEGRSHGHGGRAGMVRPAMDRCQRIGAGAQVP